jgi:clan AA aspartic protease
VIAGVVTAAREATIPLTVYDAVGEVHQFTGVVDTGFNGALTVAPNLIERLGLAWSGRDIAVLADGSEKVFDFYEAIIEWDGTPRRMIVLSADSDPLVGMTLLAGYELTIQAVPGGTVTIAPLQ